MNPKSEQLSNALTIVAHSTGTHSTEAQSTTFHKTFSGGPGVGDPRLWLHVLSFAFKRDKYDNPFNLTIAAYLGKFRRWKNLIRRNNIARIVGSNAFIPLFTHNRAYEKIMIQIVKENHIESEMPYNCLVLFYMALFCSEESLETIFDGNEKDFYNYTEQWIQGQWYNIADYYKPFIDNIRFIQVLERIYKSSLQFTPYDPKLEFLKSMKPIKIPSHYDVDFIKSKEFLDPIEISNGKQTIHVGVFQTNLAKHIRKTRNANESKDPGELKDPDELKDIVLSEDEKICQQIYQNINNPEFHKHLVYDEENIRPLLRTLLNYSDLRNSLDILVDAFYVLTLRSTTIPFETVKKLFHAKCKHRIHEVYGLP